VTTYVLIDAMNMYHRSKHSVSGDLDTKVGMSLHITFSSIKKAYKELGGDHIVFCNEGRSWRKNYYAPYKANRAIARAKLSPREQEEDKIFIEAFNDLSEFFLEKTNATVLRCPVAEADDMIATWIEMHPEDNHVIISSDTDFVQLLSPRVKIYNGITETTYTHDAVYNKRGQKLQFELKSDGKIKTGKPDDSFVPEQDWIEKSLFIKCVRGDKSDNVFPAFPGARIKGTKNKTGILEAFHDRHNGGYNWNNFMLQKWSDVDGNERLVKEEYEINRELIDLTQQPEKYKIQFIDSVLNEVRKNRVNSVGIHFLKFCSRWNLQQISKFPDEYAQILNSTYSGNLLDALVIDNDTEKVLMHKAKDLSSGKTNLSGPWSAAEWEGRND